MFLYPCRQDKCGKNYNNHNFCLIFRNGEQQSRFVQWLHRHSNIVPIIFYTLLLIFIGLLSSKRFWKRFQQIYEETFDRLGWTDHSFL